MEFQREARYIVVKLTDLASAGLSRGEIDAFNNFCDKIAIARASHGKPPLQCVVIESDWPEYEPTWDAIKVRMEGELPERLRGTKALKDLLRECLTELDDEVNFSLMNDIRRVLK